MYIELRTYTGKYHIQPSCKRTTISSCLHQVALFLRIRFSVHASFFTFKSGFICLQLSTSTKPTATARTLLTHLCYESKPPWRNNFYKSLWIQINFLSTSVFDVGKVKKILRSTLFRTLFRCEISLLCSVKSRRCWSLEAIQFFGYHWSIFKLEKPKKLK